MKAFILPYSNVSQSARALAEAMGCKTIKRGPSSKFKPKPEIVVFNWGSCTLPPHVEGAYMLNAIPHVRTAAHKVMAFRYMQDAGVSIVPMTEEIDDARAWSEEEGTIIMCRTVVRGRGGAGIVVAHSPDELVSAPLYTRYVKKRDEYRVHVFQGEVLDVQRKMRSTKVSDADVDWKIRSHSRGFVFGREGVSPDDSVLEQSLKAVQALNLDYGAVDIIWNNYFNKAYVLEVNTACGLEGATLHSYSSAFNKYLKEYSK